VAKSEQDLGQLRHRVDAHDASLLRTVDELARVFALPKRPLLLQALLQLPRIADGEGFVESSSAFALLTELAGELPPIEAWRTTTQIPSVHSLRFEPVEMEAARVVMSQFHYLRSPRTDGRCYGLLTENRALVALSVSSPNDVPHVRELLTSVGAAPTNTRMISRVFVFEGAPRNTISHLLSRVARAERKLGVTNLATYVNPNMGFSGVSYQASGWRVLGNERTRYRYLDARYVTDRELVEQFGRHSDHQYREILGARFAVTVMNLQPLLLFFTGIDGH
jgi:hypothetical protein